MNHTEQRKKLRLLIADKKCHLPASVFDPMSARIAESAGYEIGLLMGSVFAQATLTAPDLCLYTITEYADHIRRIMRVCNLSLLVDGDHGHGNALNVMRTVQELEHAGVSALTIEDTSLPLSFGQAKSENRLISIEEGAGKMRAAVAARQDPSLLIVARTSALKLEGIEGVVARAKAYAAAGVDMFCIAGGLEKLEHIEAIYAAARLPIVLGSHFGSLTLDQLASNGARILNPGHHAIKVSVKALRETYTHLHSGGASALLKSKVASPEEMEKLTSGEKYKQWLREFMH